MSLERNSCGICGKEFTENDLWEEIQEGAHKRCDKKLKRMATLMREPHNQKR